MQWRPVTCARFGVGYGLQIVDRMAAAWGTGGARDEQIWFELARS